MRVERTLDAGLDARMAQLEAQCPGWAVSGERDPDLVVVMYSSEEREAAVYYGADQGPALESRWEPAVDTMIAQFRRERFTDGVVDGLAALTAPAPVELPVEPPVAGGDDRGARAPTGAIVVLVLVLAVIAGISVGRYVLTGEWGDTSSSSSWCSTSRTRRRSFGSFGGFGGSGGSSSAHRSPSGGGSRRAGGGSKRW